MEWWLLCNSGSAQLLSAIMLDPTALKDVFCVDISNFVNEVYKAEFMSVL